MSTPLPDGFRIALDPSAKQLADDLWFGGSPARVVRLTAAGQLAWRELAAGPVASPAAGMLARRLTDAGLAHPVPPAVGSPEVTVVIPVRDRPLSLARCLAALDGRHPVLVVDDGSRDARAVAVVVDRYGAKLVRRPANGGPAAARNTAAAQVTTELIAFLDSDCVPVPGWVDALTPHFADPKVAAVAPRITDAGLDLGGQPARVLPNTRVAYVPTAALLVRRELVSFDPALRVGEDVDLIWRLHEAGWRIRYEPSVRIGHTAPDSVGGRLIRRFRYGTSAAPLALRHPNSVPPLVLHPWPALTVLALLFRRPVLAVLAFGMSVLTMVRTLRKANIPARGVLRAMATAVYQTWRGIGHYGVQFAAPVVAAAAIRRPLAAGSLLLGPALTAWLARSPRPEPVRFLLGNLAEDIAYGAGVWTGCVSAHTTIPVRPVLAWRPLRIEK